MIRSPSMRIGLGVAIAIGVACGEQVSDSSGQRDFDQAQQPDSVAGAQQQLPAVDPRLPRMEALYLQLESEERAQLIVQVTPVERSRLQRAGGRGVIQLADGQERLELNDEGRGGDKERGDGQFTGSIPVNIPALRELSAEARDLKSRTFVRFTEGGREVLSREKLPDEPIDVRALLAGKRIRVPPVNLAGALKTLGAVPGDVSYRNALLISSLPVIEDPARTMNPCAHTRENEALKPWTFGHLMTEMAAGSGLAPAAFVEAWLQNWKDPKVIRNGSTILDGISGSSFTNLNNQVIAPWRQRSGAGPLDLRIAPFRLMAIVYRPDLGRNGYAVGGAPSAGELRFVFAFMHNIDANKDGDALDPVDTCQSLNATTIFEYGVPLTGCQGVQGFANQFVQLSALLPGSAAYGQHLERITASVTTRGRAPGKANGSAINQVRTNELDFTTALQAREFALPLEGGALRQTTTKNQPREHQYPFTRIVGVTPNPIDLNQTPLFAEFLRSDEVFSDIFAGQPFLGGAATYKNPTSWDDPAAAPTPRFLSRRAAVSLLTCSGCHTGETATDGFHIRATAPGNPPMISPFLVDPTWTVRDIRGVTHAFDESARRTQALLSLVNVACDRRRLPLPFELFQLPLESTH